MAKLKICVLIAGFGIGGAQKQCIYLLNELQSDPDLELHLIHYYEGINFDLLKQENLKIHQLEVSSFYNPKNIINLVKLIKGIGPDILFSWLHASDVYSYFISKFIPKMKWIMTERDSFYPFDLRYKLRGFAGKGADLIICNSVKGKAYWEEKGVKPAKVAVVKNILLPAVKKKTLELGGSPVITYAGRLEVQKNVITLANAFCVLADKHKAAKFLIIGEGILDGQLQEIIKTEGKADNVSLIPYQKNILAYFSATDVFVNISAHEGMPNTIIENILLANKIVASKIPEHEEILGAVYPYYVEDPHNVNEVADVIERILTENNIEAHLAYGRKQLEQMSAEKVGNAYKKLFKQTVN